MSAWVLEYPVLFLCTHDRTQEPEPEPEPAQQASQDSDAMYDEADAQITPSQAMILDAMELIHQPVSRSHVTKLCWC